jgi:hypothetical protein
VKTIKGVGLLAMAGILATALIGPPIAMGETTALCEVDESPCKSPVSHVHNSGEIEVITSVMTYTCDALFLGEASELGEPQKVVGNFTYTNCKVKGSSGSCERQEENGPSTLTFLKEGHEFAKGTGESLVHVVCSGFIDCSYTLVGEFASVLGPLLSKDNNGEITFTEQAMQKEAGGFLCPKTAKLNATFVPLTPTYISS